jgi:hypothetical protein
MDTELKFNVRKKYNENARSGFAAACAKGGAGV